MNRRNRTSWTSTPLRTRTALVVAWSMVLAACSIEATTDGAETPIVPEVCDLGLASPADLNDQLDLDLDVLDPDAAGVSDFESQLDAFDDVLDRSVFDVAARATNLGTPEAAIRFVSSEIGYETYDGLLRGAAGALESQAGNHLDRAVLLDALLSELGQETRLSVVSAGPNTSGPGPSIDARPMASNGLVEVAARFAGTTWDDPIGSFLADVASFGATGLDQASLDGRSEDAARNEYFFVETREGSDWAAHHTIEVVPSGSTRVVEADHLEGLRHHVTLTVINGTVAGEQVLLEQQFAVDDLFGTTLTLANRHEVDEPDTDRPDFGSLEDLLDESRVFRPVLLVDDDLIEGTEFELGTSGGDASLLWQRLEITEFRPDGTRLAHERFLYRATRDGVDDSVAVARLVGSTRIAVMGGRPSAERVAADIAAGYRWLTTVVDPPSALGDSLFGGIAGPAQDEEPVDPGDQIVAGLEAAGERPSDLDAFFVFSDRLAGSDSYRHQAAIVLFREWMERDGALKNTIDIVTNPRRSRSGGSVVQPGVNDAYLEACLSAMTIAGSAPGSTTTSAVALIEASTPVGVAGGHDDLLELEPTAFETSAMSQDLANGSTLEVFRHPDTGQLSWWATNQQAGSTIARTDAGGHAAATVVLPFATTGYATTLRVLGYVTDGALLLACLTAAATVGNVAGIAWCIAELGMGKALGALVGKLFKLRFQARFWKAADPDDANSAIRELIRAGYLDDDVLKRMSAVADDPAQMRRILDDYLRELELNGALAGVSTKIGDQFWKIILLVVDQL